MSTRKLILALALGLAAVTAVYAASSAVISFLDSSNEPAYMATGTGLVNEAEACGESETGGDVVTMLMTDANGLITDIDTFCLDSETGDGYDYTDWWSYEGATGDPTLGPITYSLYDTAPGDACENENSISCAEYLASGAVRCIAEDYYQPPGLPAGARFPVCNAQNPNTCIPIPAGSVIGDMPFSTQAYYSPGNLAPGVVVNPGTYWVVGVDESGAFYKIILACQYLWVPIDSMQPSYQAPQSGEALPTRVVS